MQFTYFFGVDVSKATLDFAVAKGNQILFHQQVANDKKGITQFIKDLRQQTKTSLGQCLFCMEFTGIYNNPLLKALHQQSANIWVERAAHIQESIGLTRVKTDQVDAKRIALFAYKNRDEARLWTPPRAVIAQLDRLTAQRARLVKVIKILQTPLTRLKSPYGILEEEHTRRLISTYLQAAPMDIYDIGGGTGPYSAWLAEAGHHVYFSDIVPHHVELFKSRYGSSKPGISIGVEDARQLSYEDNVADLILLNGPLYHLIDRQDRLRVLTEAKRILKDTGLLLGFSISRFAGLIYALSSGEVFNNDYFEMEAV
ncbi:transposase [Spirosoma sp. HMF4905]|uniref:Transposase n=1 Tax=Spirosoma arboris TaxID=2682092 RepID=A0A7K1SJQ7_9BACT|nr:transposase [Spirosoma arboris]MVM34015.1 transposase [Spirosoma arboris]